MEHPFDAFSRSLAAPRSRRALLRQFGMALVGTAAASLRPRWASGRPVSAPTHAVAAASTPATAPLAAPAPGFDSPPQQLAPGSPAS